MRARVALAAVAIGCLLVLGFWMRATVNEDRGYQLSLNVLRINDPAVANRARGYFDRAQEHNPDTRPLLLEGDMLLKARRFREAAVVLRELVHEEPENVDGWALLAASTEPFDRAASQRARTRLRRLNPLGLGNSGG